MRQNNRGRVFFKISVYFAALFVLIFLFSSFNLTNSADGKTNNLASVLLAPVSVNKSAMIATDNNGNGHVNPGDVIEYSITVSNGGTPASSVIFSDVLSPELTLVPGSVKAAPVAGDDSYQTIGNTQLQVAASQTIQAPGIFVNGNVLSNDNDLNGGTLSASAGATSASGGTVAMNSDGTFTYTPPAGFTGTDTFTYNLTDNPNDGFTVTGTVSITVNNLVWYVKNNAPAGGNGTSTNPFNTLTAAQNAPVTPSGDTIYVFTGDGTTNNQNSGITLDANQRLIGAGVALTVPVSVNGGPNPTVLLAAGTKPKIGNSAGNGVSVTNISGVQIRGLDIWGSGAGSNAIDVTTSGASGGGVEIADNAISAATAEGIDVNGGGGSGTLTVSIHDNTVTATGNGIDINCTAGNVIITAFDDNVISGNTGGTGVNVVGTGATIVFDANPGTAAFDTVLGGNTAIGQSGNGVGASGLVLSNVSGDLSFSDLDIFADNGNALFISGTTPNFNAGTATGMRFTANTGSPVLSANGGSAANVTDANISLALSNLTSSISTATQGVSLTRVSGTFSAPSGSAITSTNASGTGFFIDGGSNANANVAVTYDGTITADIGRLVQIQNVTASGTHTFSGAITDNDDGDGGETGVFLNNNSGATITFRGGLAIRTTTSAAFTATGGGTVNVCDENPCNPASTGALINKLTTTTGTALNVANTTIGANGFTFRSITANGAVNGINLSNTGSSAGLTVAGNGGVCTVATPTCTGGIIQNTTSHGINMSNVANAVFNSMRVSGADDSGINGTTVNGFVLNNSLIDANGDSAATDDSGVKLAELTGTASGGANPTSITNTVIRNNFEFELSITNNGAGTLINLQMSGNTISADGTQPNHGNLFNFLSFGTGAMTLNLTSGTFNGNVDTSGGKIITATALQCDHSGTGGVMTCNVSNATFTNNNVGPQGSVAANGQMVIDFNGNNIQNSRAHGINIFADANAPYTKTIQGRIRNNTIGSSGTVNSGAATGFPIRIQNEGRVNVALNIDNNDIFQSPNAGINLNHGISSANGTGTSALTVTNNGINNITASRGIILSQNDIIGGGAHGTVCADVSANSFSSIAGQGGDGTFIRVRRGAQTGGTATFTVRQATPTAAANAAELDDANGFNDPSKISVSGTPTFNAGTCAQPSNLASLGEKVLENNYAFNFHSFGDFRTPAELLISSEPRAKHIDNAETISTNQTVDFVKANSQVVIENTVFADYKEPAGLAVSENLSNSGNFDNAVYRLTSALYSSAKYLASFEFIPRAHAEEAEASTVMAGETVCVDGDSSTAPPCNGPGFNLPANKSTTIKFRATVNASTTATNVSNTANITAAGGINASSNQVNTPVVQAPAVAKDFVATFISIGATTSLNFTVTNPNPTPLTGVSVTDVLPAGLSVADATSSVCGGTNNLVTTASNRTIQLTGATVPANNGTCTFSITVTGAAEGEKVNITGNVNSPQGGQGGTATDTVTVINPPTLVKTFTPNQIQLIGTSTLEFTLSNPNSSLLLNTLAFTDTLPSGVTAPNTAGTTVCGNGSFSVSSNVVSFSKPSLAAGTNCVFSITVTGASAGLKTNTTSTVTTSNSTAGTAAMANLTVIAPPTIAKAFSPTSIVEDGTSTVTLTLTNPNTTGALTNASFTDTLVNMSAVGGAIGGTCAGTTPNTLVAGATALSFSGITIPNNGNCTVTFSVKSNSVGTNPNTTSGITTNQTPVAGTASNTANLTVIAAADLTITKTHAGNFTQGDTGKTYTITVTNSGGTPSSGTVTVTDTLPSGLTATAISGTGWSCALGTLTCTRSDVLNNGSSYPAITLTVNVANNAPASVTNTASVSGGGELNTGNNTANDPTTINPAATYTISGQVTNGGAALSGVSVALSGTSTASTVTDASGNYSFSNLTGGGNYTVTPSLNGYTFNPTSTPVNNLTSNQTDINFATTTVAYEADAAPRPAGDGDGTVNGGDITVIRKFVAGIETPAAPADGSEFQRVDGAPLYDANNNLVKGDGTINGGDITQVRRFAAGLDAVVPSGGPATAVLPPPMNAKFDSAERMSLDANQIAATRDVRPVKVSLASNVLTVGVYLNTDPADTAANTVDFTLQYDAAVLSNPTNIRLGNSAPAATTITPNTAQTGKVGIVLDLPVVGATTIFPTGDAQLVLIDFIVAAMPPATTTIGFGDTPVQRFVGDINGNRLTTTFSSGSISLLAPTAASVTIGGRVVSEKGRGINRATVIMTDQTGNVRSTLTNPFGYYRFDDIEAGQVVVLTAKAKRYEFAQPTLVLQVTEELTEVNFTAIAAVKLR